MSLGLTFQSKEILNSHLNNGHSNLYTTSSDRGMLGRKVTSLDKAGFLSGSAGKIHWRDKTFEIGGRHRNGRNSRALLDGLLRREWEWSGYTYTVKHAHHKWTVTNSHGEVACLTEYKPHLLRSNEHATLRISPEIQDEHQRAFIILVLLYSETKRQDKAKTADIAGALAG
ncbi:hypothetical protein B0H13DRAFT_2350795 [Mycena leptocephala]|nr:hypothetical protein B0H13DRAFT_2350795 [Mycena leptocephala]